MKFINYRTFLYTAVNVLIGSFIGVLTCISMILGILLFIVSIFINIILLIFNFRNFKYAAGFSVAAIALMIMMIFSLIAANVKYADIDYSQTHKVTGDVFSVSRDIGECDIIVKNIAIDGKRNTGKIKIYVETEIYDKTEFLQEGYAIEFRAQLRKTEVFQNGFINTFSTNKNIRYTAYLSSDSIEYTPQKTGFLTDLHVKLKNMLTDFMGIHYGNIAYGILSGNRDDIDFNTQNYFSASGLGHILAVSGLHLGFIISLLMFLLKSVSPKIKVPIIVFLMTLYAVFAGCSASVIRATIMSTVGLVTLINGQRSDLLNNLSLAFTVIVATSPFVLFDAGFLMSFSAVFGIACFSAAITKLLRKIKFPKVLASAISVSVAAQIGITPCLLFFFHNLPLYSIIVNIILMPLITLTFILLLIFCIICLIISNNALLVIPQTLLIILDGTASFVANLPLSQITLYVGIGIFLLLPLYFIMSRYFMLPKFKWALNLSIFVCCIALCAISIKTFNPIDTIIPISSYNDVSSIVYKDNKVLLIGDCKNGKQIKRIANSRFVKKFDAIYLTSLSEVTAQSVVYLMQTMDCGTVYCSYSNNMDGLISFIDNDVQIEIIEMGDTVPFLNIEYNENAFAGYSINILDSQKAVFISYKTDYSKLNADLLSSTSVFRCRAFTGYLNDRIFLTNYLLDSVMQEGKYVYSVKDLGDYAFNYSNGEIYG